MAGLDVGAADTSADAGLGAGERAAAGGAAAEAEGGATCASLAVHAGEAFLPTVRYGVAGAIQFCVTILTHARARLSARLPMLLSQTTAVDETKTQNQIEKFLS